MIQTETKITTGATAKRALLSRPEFFLFYLPFYFVPWLFVSPTGKDMAAAIIAIVVFLPLYFRSFENSSPVAIGYIVAIELIAIASGSFSGNSGVFHVYACSAVGFQLPRSRAIGLMIGLSLVWLTAAYLIGVHPINLYGSLFFGVMTGLIVIASWREMIKQRAIEKAHTRERQLTAIDERERIAHDLHDVLGHTLTTTALKADLAIKLIDTNASLAKQEITDIHTITRNALQDVRRAVEGMALSRVDDELEQTQQALTAANIKLTILGDIPPLSESESHTLGLALREATTNILRHSSATTVVIDIQVQEQSLMLTIADDGGSGAIQEGIGLSGLRRRIESIEGSVKLDTQPEGFTLMITIPLAAALAR